MFEIVNGRRTDDGRTPEHGYTISSPCEPNGSGELITKTNYGVTQQSTVYKQPKMYTKPNQGFAGLLQHSYHLRDVITSTTVWPMLRF